MITPDLGPNWNTVADKVRLLVEQKKIDVTLSIKEDESDWKNEHWMVRAKYRVSIDFTADVLDPLPEEFIRLTVFHFRPFPSVRQINDLLRNAGYRYPGISCLLAYRDDDLSTLAKNLSNFYHTHRSGERPLDDFHLSLGVRLVVEGREMLHSPLTNCKIIQIRHLLSEAARKELDAHAKEAEARSVPREKTWRDKDSFGFCNGI